MGNYLFSFPTTLCCSPKRKLKVIIHGLDASGKTTILYKLKNPSKDVVTTIPTIGFNVETIDIDGFEFTAWDVGGRDKIRPLWRHYYPGTDSIIFVIDSNDTDRLDFARDEMHRIKNEEELQGIPLLIYCNKQDLPLAKSSDEISEQIGVSVLRDKREVIVQGCSALTGEGLYEGLELLVQAHSNTADKTEREHQDEQKSEQKGKKHVGTSPTIASRKYKDSNWQHGTPLEYEPFRNNVTLDRFQPIKQGTECPFAKRAKLWGGKTLTYTMEFSSLENQARENIVALTEFTRRSNLGNNLDGFCIELDDPLARNGNPEDFGKCVARFLTKLAELDPSGENMMNVNYIGDRGWRFRFNKTDFFVTTFAPCYPATSSRYAFGVERAFMLLQPEESFARHNIPTDSAITNWDHPQTIRDQTRVAFQQAGRPYFIPETTKYPMAEHIVKPIHDNGLNVVHWWKHAGVNKQRST